MIKRFNMIAEQFAEIVSGKKTFVLSDTNIEEDEEIQVGDLLAINEWDGENECFTDRSVLVYADHVQEDRNYLRPGCMVVSIKPCYVQKAEAPYNPCRMSSDYGVPVIERVIEKS